MRWRRSARNDCRFDVVTAETEHVVHESPDRHVPHSDIGADTMAASSTRGSGSQADQEDALDAAGLNPRYTFETFVKGASNQFALAAALRVAETPARSYNPLFIYGSAGLGKTHLLHAIGHYVHSNYQHHVVRYVSTETFMNEYVDAIRSNSMAGLRRKYREIDVLLIDDVQFLEGKEGLQEEFFHTFNSLHGAQQADRDLVGSYARRDPHARGTTARPLQVGADHRHPAARPRDPARHSPQQGRA